MRRGEQQANAQRDLYGGIGQSIAGLGAEAGNLIGQRQEQKRASVQDQAFLRRVSDPKAPPLTPQETIQIYGPERGMAIFKGFQALKSPEPDLKTVMAGLEAGGETLRAESWPLSRQHLLKLGVPGVPEQYDEGYYQRFKQAVAGEKPAAPYSLNPGEKRFGADNQMVAENPAAAKTAAVGSFEDYVTRTAGPNPTPEQIVKARKEYGQADDRARVTVTTGSGMSPTMEANVINRLSNQWKAAVAPTVELDRQVKLLDAGLEESRKGNRAQGDQTVLVTFQKILDPPSVVRESEYMRSAAGQAMMDRVKGAIQKIKEGGAGLSLDQLEKFADLARTAAKAQAKGYSEAVKERLGKTADRYKIPRELVFEDYSFDFGGGAGAIKDDSEYDALPSGAIFTDPEGKQRRKP